MFPDFSGEGVVLWKLQFRGRTADLLQLMDENISLSVIMAEFMFGDLNSSLVKSVCFISYP